jgi:hypothetical protein
MTLYHFSEEPGIHVFEPRVAPSTAEKEALVWAIHHDRQMMYFTPRDCPRACFWPGELTTPEDRARWFGNVSARMIIAIESRWLDRLRAATLCRYTMPEASFTPARGDGSGHWVSRQTVVPTVIEPMTDLLAALAASGVELRITPSLIELWKDVIQSSLQFSGTRLRNAEGWSTVDWDAIPLGAHASMPAP